MHRGDLKQIKLRGQIKQRQPEHIIVRNCTKHLLMYGMSLILNKFSVDKTETEIPHVSFLMDGTSTFYKWL